MQNLTTLSFTPEQITILNKCLGLGQYSEVAPLVQDLNRQVQEARAVTETPLPSIQPTE
jgi:hypothetical protein